MVRIRTDASWIIDVHDETIATIYGMIVFVAKSDVDDEQQEKREEHADFLSNRAFWSCFLGFAIQNLFPARMNESREATTLIETGRFAPGAWELQVCHSD